MRRDALVVRSQERCPRCVLGRRDALVVLLTPTVLSCTHTHTHTHRPRASLCAHSHTVQRPRCRRDALVVLLTHGPLVHCTRASSPHRCHVSIGEEVCGVSSSGARNCRLLAVKEASNPKPQTLNPKPAGDDARGVPSGARLGFPGAAADAGEGREQSRRRQHGCDEYAGAAGSGAAAASSSSGGRHGSGG